MFSKKQIRILFIIASLFVLAAMYIYSLPNKTANGTFNSPDAVNVSSTSSNHDTQTDNWIHELSADPKLLNKYELIEIGELGQKLPHVMTLADAKQLLGNPTKLSQILFENQPAIRATWTGISANNFLAYYEIIFVENQAIMKKISGMPYQTRLNSQSIQALVDQPLRENEDTLTYIQDYQLGLPNGIESSYQNGNLIETYAWTATGSGGDKQILLITFENQLVIEKRISENALF